MKKVEAYLLEKKSEAFSAMPGNYFYILTEMWWTYVGNNPFSTICFKSERLWAIWLHSSHNGLIAPYQLKYIPTMLKFIPSKGHMPLKQLMPTPLVTNPPEHRLLYTWTTHRKFPHCIRPPMGKRVLKLNAHFSARNDLIAVLFLFYGFVLQKMVIFE